MLDDRKSQSGTAGLLRVALIHAVKTLKDAFLMLRRDADARILDSQYGFFTHAADRHHHLPAFPIILDRVIAEIIADLREQALDAAKSKRLTAKGQTDLSLLRRICQRIRRLTRDLRKIADLKRQLAALIELREANDILDQAH